jgi:hypothetical protein
MYNKVLTILCNGCIIKKVRRGVIFALENKKLANLMEIRYEQEERTGNPVHQERIAHCLSDLWVYRPALQTSPAMSVLRGRTLTKEKEKEDVFYATS